MHEAEVVEPRCRGLVGGAVDAEGQAGDDGPALAAEVRAEGARGQQAPDSIPFEALAGDLVGGNVGAAMAGQDEFGEPPGLVPAVVGG